MIRFIVAIDSKRGLADDKGIPWNLPEDKRYYREKIKTAPILMGYNTYIEHDSPMNDKPNYVATRTDKPLKEGFTAVTHPAKFLDEFYQTKDIWVIGGAGLFDSLLDKADELYITKIEGDFNCTKFFPDYSEDFELASQTETKTDNSISYRFTIYKRKK
jgi:dihydrofolate reductase